MKHLSSYLSPTKAYALSYVLRVAPLKYKVEYAVYMILVLSLMALSIVSIEFSLLISGALILASSLWSLSVYGSELDFALRVLGGPAVLVSRLLRALSLIVYPLIAIFQQKTQL